MGARQVGGEVEKGRMVLKHGDLLSRLLCLGPCHRWRGGRGRLLSDAGKYILLLGNSNRYCEVVSKPKGNQVQVLGYYSPDAAEQLRKLSETTHIPQAALLREALDDLLKKRSGTAKKPRRIGGHTGEYLAQAFSDIELLVAADVIKSAIAEGKKHLDPKALARVLAKLTMAYKYKAAKREG